MSEGGDLERWLNLPVSIEIGDLAIGATESFRILESWCVMQEPSDPTVVAIRKSIVLHAGLYTRAIDESLKMAQMGITFAETAIKYTNRLFERPSTEDLITIVATMSDLATQGRKTASDTNEKFKRVRGGFIQIYRGRRDTGGATHETTSPDDIELHSVRGSSQRARDNELLRKPSQEVIRQLHRAADDLETLIRQVGMYVDWWDEKVTNFGSLESLTAFIVTIDNNTISKEDVRDRWQGISKQYHDYKRQISLVQDFYVSNQLQLGLEGQDAAEPETPIAGVMEEVVQRKGFFHYLTCGCCG